MSVNPFLSAVSAAAAPGVAPRANPFAAALGGALGAAAPVLPNAVPQQAAPQLAPATAAAPPTLPAAQPAIAVTPASAVIATPVRATPPALPAEAAAALGTGGATAAAALVGAVARAPAQGVSGAASLAAAPRPAAPRPAAALDSDSDDDDVLAANAPRAGSAAVAVAAVVAPAAPHRTIVSVVGSDDDDDDDGGAPGAVFAPLLSPIRVTGASPPYASTSVVSGSSVSAGASATSYAAVHIAPLSAVKSAAGISALVGGNVHKPGGGRTSPPRALSSPTPLAATDDVARAELRVRLNRVRGLVRIALVCAGSAFVVGIAAAAAPWLFLSYPSGFSFANNAQTLTLGLATVSVCTDTTPLLGGQCSQYTYFGITDTGAPGAPSFTAVGPSAAVALALTLVGILAHGAGALCAFKLLRAMANTANEGGSRAAPHCGRWGTAYTATALIATGFTCSWLGSFVAWSVCTAFSSVAPSYYIFGAGASTFYLASSAVGQVCGWGNVCCWEEADCQRVSPLFSSHPSHSQLFAAFTMALSTVSLAFVVASKIALRQGALTDTVLSLHGKAILEEFLGARAEARWYC